MEEQNKPQVIEGRKTEERFAQLFDNPTFSNVEQDRFEHWDVEVDGKKFDVKGIKVSASREKPDEMHHIIELRNNKGEEGWLYGKADAFAFETKDYWVIVEAEALRDFIAKNIQKVRVRKFGREFLYKLYHWTKNDAKAILTMVKTLDLMYLASEIKKK